MNNVSEAELYKLYVTDRKTMKQISVELGIAVGKIHKLIHKYGIKARSIRDYPPTEKQIEHSKKLGMSKKGTSLSEEQKRTISEARKIHRPGHIKIHSHGYRMLYYPDYPSSDKNGYVMEHRYIMEKHLGRQLREDECVHHINFDKKDNRIENLQVMSKSAHMSYHMQLRKEKR